MTESFHLLGHNGGPRLSELLRRQAVVLATAFGDQLGRILDLMDKYADVPMSFTDACLVRVSEVLPDPVVITPMPISESTGGSAARLCLACFSDRVGLLSRLGISTPGAGARLSQPQHVRPKRSVQPLRTRRQVPSRCG